MRAAEKNRTNRSVQKSLGQVCRTALVLALLFFSQRLALPAALAAENDMRGVWIATVYSIDFPRTSTALEQQKELRDILDNAEHAGLNAIFFQVRPTGDAYYKSEVFPWARSLTGTAGRDPGWDPLAYLIEQAAQRGIEVHAWINPYRLTEGSVSSPRNKLSDLPAAHPVHQNPDIAVPHDDGKLYLDPGNPIAVDLVIRGVEEIVRNYDVAGIHFDDYFYPNASVTRDGKTYAAVFDDAAMYARHGSGRTLSDWRRANTRTLVARTQEAVKAINPRVAFGIAPSGIWRNARNDPLGSDTNGFESYSAIYADTRGWVKEGLLDYITPQLYWTIGQSGSDYDILLRWWSDVSTGTGVKLYIGHAAYQVGSSARWGAEEIPAQLLLNKTVGGVSGDIFYGYSNIRDNKLGLADLLRAHYAMQPTVQQPVTPPVAPVVPEQPSTAIRGAPTVTSLVIAAPSNGASTTAANSFIIGAGDPAHPIRVNGETIERTESGYFAMYVPLSIGTNTYRFEHKGSTTTHTIRRTTPAVTPPPNYTLNAHDFLEGSLFPTTDRRYAPGETFTLSCIAPDGMAVTVMLDGTSYNLTPGDLLSSAGVRSRRYSVTVTMKERSSLGLINLGKPRYSFVREGRTISRAATHDIYCYMHDPLLVGTIEQGSTIMRVSNTSSAARITPLWTGTQDYILWETGEYYQFRYGGWTLKTGVSLSRRELPENMVTSLFGYVTTRSTILRWKMPVGAPYTIRELENAFEISFHNTSDHRPYVLLPQNPLFQSASYRQSGNDAVYSFSTKNPEWIFGYTVSYTSGYMTITFRNPPLIQDPVVPLAGHTIALDAGHGGSDPGATGPLGTRGDRESHLNLRVAHAVERKLLMLGAKVEMLRTEDTYLSLEDRQAAIRNMKPTLSISIHHNSVDYSTDISKVFGGLTLYSEDFSARFARVVQRELVAATGARDRGAQFQGLAVCRIQECPSILVEVGFITNPFEYEVLSTDAYIEMGAQGIVNGILAYIRG